MKTVLKVQVLVELAAPIDYSPAVAISVIAEQGRCLAVEKLAKHDDISMVKVQKVILDIPEQSNAKMP